MHYIHVYRCQTCANKEWPGAPGSTVAASQRNISGGATCVDFVAYSLHSLVFALLYLNDACRCTCLGTV